MDPRYLGIDIGAETIKIAEILCRDGHLQWTRHRLEEHRKDPGPELLRMLHDFDLDEVHAVAVFDGVVNVGPLECMPTKIAEAQFYHAAVREGLLAITVSLNGDPMDIEVVDNFAYEVHRRFRRVQQQ